LGSEASLYEISFGKKPFNIPQYIARTSNLEAIDEFLTNREVVFSKIRKKLLKARALMKQIAYTK